MSENNSEKSCSAFLKGLASWFGFERNSNYVRNYFADVNVHTSVYMSFIILGLEIYVMYYKLSKAFDAGLVLKGFTLYREGEKYKTLFKVLKDNLLLSAVALVMLLFAAYYRKNAHSGDQKLRRKLTVFSFLLDIVFSYICLYFGFVTSRSDYEKGNQILTFVTMILFVACLLIWSPYASTVILAVIFWCFLRFGVDYFALTSVNGSNGDRINYATFFISLLMVSFSIYHQRKAEAIKDESLESANRILKKMTVTDDLTGISNMSNFVYEAKQELADPETDPKSLVFLFVDISNFGNFNDKYGYEEGNKLLRRTAEILTEAFPSSLVARQSDDHFVVLTETANVKQLDVVKERIREGYTDIRLGLKAGGYYPADRETDPNIACDRARYASTTIKKQFDDDYAVYDETMADSFARRQYIINNLDTAIENGYIRPYYQPVVWAENHKLCGFEALARWIDPDHGFMSPGDFIPILEEYRQIYKLDLAIMRSALADIKRSMDMGFPGIPVSLNFSRVDFERAGLVGELESAIRDAGIPRELIHVEVTESTLSQYQSRMHETLTELHDKGYAIWLDDFGSGYSALNVLKDFAFDVMKIDMIFLKGFESNPKCRVVLKNVVDLAGAVSMRTLTEGVETKEQAEYLRSIGCERLQGYLFGKPMPFEEATQKISDGTLVVSEELMIPGTDAK